MKLVRDKIPAIAAAKNEVFNHRIATPAEYHVLLRDKLFEETLEFLGGEDPLELADILEVVRTLARTKGLTLDDIIRLAGIKRATRGGFDAGIIWLG